MRILLISSAALPVPPPKYGGLELVVHDLATALAKLGNEVAVAAPLQSRLPEGIKLIPTVDLTRNAFDEGRALREYLDMASAYEVIHDHSHAKLIYAHHKNDNPPLLSTLHCPTSVLYPTLEPRLVCVSRYHARRIRRLYGYRARFVYNGLDPRWFKFKRNKSDRFIWIGRPTPEKGTLEAIKFCKKLDVPLDVVTGNISPNTMSDYWVKVAQECWFLSKWKYHGEVPQERKVELLSSAKALLFPLAWPEPFGLTVIEALASGTPVIAYKTASMSELITDGVTGFLIRPGDEEGFMRAMRRVDELDPRDCRSDFMKRWTNMRMAKDYLQLYASAINGEAW